MAEGNVYPSEEDFSYFCFDFRNEAKETDKRNPYVGAMGPCYTCSYCGYVFEAGFKTEKVNSIGTASLCCKRMLFSDEAHFWLNGYVNKQNCRICSEANPQVYVETPLHPEKLTVWCALWAGGILLQKR
ncbi:hypothetical protein TNCV_2861241 [Trichonephila clavipes]|nr:hypothetical protein TNCV_2861241 [Trichonephila clavipes]